MTEATKNPGAFSWSELMTTDVDASKKFYSDVLGWKTEDMAMPQMTYTVVMAADGSKVGGIMKVPEQAAGTPPHWGSYVTVDNVDATVEKATKAGGKALMPPMDVPGVGRMCLLQDPQGATFSVITYAES